MALMLARTLIRNKTYNLQDTYAAYLYWLKSEPFDIGKTTHCGLNNQLDYDSQANGALMRISPLGIFGVNYDLEQVAVWAEQDASITHPHIVTRQTNYLYAMAIADAVRNGTGPIQLYDKIHEWATYRKIDRTILKTVKDAKHNPPEDYMHQSGWVLKAFQNVLWQLLYAESLEEGVIDTVMRGGDTDDILLKKTVVPLLHTINDLTKTMHIVQWVMFELQNEVSCKINEAAFVYFQKAKELFFRNDFFEAEFNFSKYKKLIRYETFYRHDNRDVNDPELTVIIVTYHKKKVLLRFINSILSQFKDDVEIIVVDNGLHDKMLPDLLQMPILYVKCPINLYSAEARNIGVKFARSVIFAFFDDNTFALEDHLTNVFSRYKKLNKYGLGKNLMRVLSIVRGEKKPAFLKNVYPVCAGMNSLLSGYQKFDTSCYKFLLKNGFCRILFSPYALMFCDYANKEIKYDKKAKRGKVSYSNPCYKFPGIDKFMNAIIFVFQCLNSRLYFFLASSYFFSTFRKKNNYYKSLYNNKKCTIHFFNHDKDFIDTTIPESENYESKQISHLNINCISKNLIIFNSHKLPRKLSKVPDNYAFYLYEPFTVLPQNYNTELLKKFSLLLGWNRKFLSQFNHSLYIPHAHWSKDKDYSKIFQDGLSWDKRNQEILFLGNPKSSRQYTEIYSLRVLFADWLYTNSDFKITWYSRIPLNRPYYKGPIDSKYDVISKAKFVFCPENTYDELYSWDYLTEKIFDVFVGKAVPIYMGCYNIDDYFDNSKYIDLRLFVKKDKYNYQVDFRGLEEELISLDEKRYLKQQDEVKKLLKKNQKLFFDRTASSVFKTANDLFYKYITDK